MSVKPSKLPPFDPADPLGIDDLLDPEDLAIRDTVRSWAADRILPHIAEWYENGELPGIRELARELGSLGALGMSLQGYGCAGATAVQYGLACLELEAADSGIRSLVSVQGSLAMYAIHRFGSEEQKQRWLPGMAAGEIIGCFGLTEPDHGSDPAGMRTYAKRDGEDWVLTVRKMWITNGSVAGVAVVWAQTDEGEDGRGIRGFVVPTDAPGFSAPEIHHKWSLRASVTSELVMDEVRLPADAVLPDAQGLRGPLSLEEEIAELRIATLDVFKRLCLTEHGGQLLANHRFAIAKLIKFLHSQVAKLYTIPPYACLQKHGRDGNGDHQQTMHELIIQTVNTTVRILHHILRSFDELIDLTQKVNVERGGYHAFLIGMTRIAFSEQLVLEAGIETDVVEAAHDILDNVLSPEEGEAIVKAVQTPNGTRSTTTRRDQSGDSQDNAMEVDDDDDEE